jgi:hypothetical protein
MARQGSRVIKAAGIVVRPLDNARATWPSGLFFRPIAVAALTACCVILSHAPADARNPAHARAARALSGNDNATLHLVHADGSTLYEEGRASGSLPGAVRAWFKLGATFTGHFIFYTHSGAIIGHGSATPHQGRYPYESFSGTAEIRDGTSRYRHVHGSLGFYGVFNRNGDAVQMQTRGTLAY